MSSPRTILSFDFGLRRIGVAVGQDVTGSASPLGVIENGPRGLDDARLKELVDEWRPTQLVVGMPTHVDGTPSEMQEPINAFIDRLALFGLPVDTVDERYTSIEAEHSLKSARAAGRKGRVSKEMIDSAAAVLIAERYLASS
ncbi:MAG: Holliday junction resolvase RuvX [Woeseiaceae bacterium]